MRRTLLTSASILFFATAAFAAEEAPKLTASKDLSLAPSGHYALEKNHASITFKVLHMGYAYYTMRFNDFDANLDVDAKAPEKSKVDVTIQAKSLDANNPKLTEHVGTADFLDYAKYPTITFKSTGIEKTGDHTAKITGDMTIHGVTKPVVLDATFNGGSLHPMMKQYDLGFSATTTIKRSDFGVSGFIPLVGDDIQVAIETEFLKADAPVSGEKK